MELARYKHLSSLQVIDNGRFVPKYPNLGNQPMDPDSKQSFKRIPKIAELNRADRKEVALAKNSQHRNDIIKRHKRNRIDNKLRIRLGV